MTNTNFVSLIVAVDDFSTALLALSKKDASLPYEPFIKFLEKSQDIHLLAVKNLVILFSIKKAPDSFVDTTFSFISSKLTTPDDSNLQDIGVQSYSSLLQSKWYRNLFWTQSDRVKPLIKILTTARTNLQLQYHTLLALWLVSFEKKPATQLVTVFDIVPTYFDIIKNSVKEKIIRLSVALLVNVATLSPKSGVSSLLLNDGLNFISTLADRKWADEELVADLGTLKDTLQTSFDSMTTFDEYKNELDSKKLRWSPPHRSEGFWKENAEQFKAQDWKVLKTLISIIESKPDDSVVNAVAASDINHIFAQFPEAVKVVERIGGKVAIMELMGHSSEEVRYEALKATQTLISGTL